MWPRLCVHRLSVHLRWACVQRTVWHFCTESALDKLISRYDTQPSAIRYDFIGFYSIRFNTHHFLKDFKGTVWFDMNRRWLDWWSVLWTGRTTPPDKRKQTNVSSAYADSCLCCEYYIINLLVLLAKYHIHKSKFSNHKPSFSIFEKELKQYITTILHSITEKPSKPLSYALYITFLWIIYHCFV